MTQPTIDRLARSSAGSRLPDRAFRGVTRTLAFGVLGLLIAIAAVLVASSAPTWTKFGLDFLTGRSWDVVQGVYGALPFVAGTLETALLALLLATPIGLLTAVFLAEFAPRRVAIPLTFLIELLAAIPSVVIGLWGVFVLSPFLRDTVETWIVGAFGWVPFLAGPTFGIGLFSAGVILAIMILPTIVAISREVIGSIPLAQREAMLALGATRWETTWRVVLPAARSGIVGAVILGLGRALGETMAVTMVIGNNDAIPSRLFDQGQTIASKIATSFNEAQVGIQSSSLIALGLVLLALTIALNVVARLLVRRAAHGAGAGSSR